MVGIAMIGCGAISGIYLKNITETFREIRLVGVCDLIPERAQTAHDFVEAQKENGIACESVKIYKDMYEAFADPEVQVVLNLTRPYEHFDVSCAALKAGKNVYSEKPLAVDMEEANEILSIAKEKNLYVGGAPDTFMGAGIQTCRKLIDDGVIGDIVGANVAMICHGHETWHPDPEFYYKRGGGPMLDMGPYYVTALVHLLGEVKGVMGMTKKSFDQRIITSNPHYGEVIDVDIDTYLAGNLLFSSGAIAQVFTTFDVYYTMQPHFEIYGTKGTLAVPDPNTFGGPVLLYRPEDHANGPVTDPGLAKRSATDPYVHFKEIPLMFDYRENSRALGLADLCKAIETGRDWRANWQQQLHVLEVLTAFSKSSQSGKLYEMTTKYARTTPMCNNPMHGILD